MKCVYLVSFGLLSLLSLQAGESTWYYHATGSTNETFFSTANVDCLGACGHHCRRRRGGGQLHATFAGSGRSTANCLAGDSTRADRGALGTARRYAVGNRVAIPGDGRHDQAG